MDSSAGRWRVRGPWRIQVKESTQSTNDDVRKLAEAGEPQGCVVVARSQMCGRGQWKRRWVSPEGGLYFSFLLRPDAPVSEWPALSKQMAESVRSALIAAFGVAPSALRVKEPNDVVCDAGKVCGTVLEAVDGKYLVVGIGVNVLIPVDAVVTDGRNVPAYLARLADSARIPQANVAVYDAYGRDEVLDRVLFAILDEVARSL